MKIIVFAKKELIEAIRSGKVLILGLVFVLFGIMNPAIAKLTPWMLEMLSDQLAEAGMTVNDVMVDASASWAQFFKNAPIALIIYILVCGGIFTKEYQSGTLVLLLTKGLKRSEVVIAKAMVLFSGWTAAYFICFAVTYGYNAYFWDNGVMHNLNDSVLGWWLFGIYVVALTVFFSALCKGLSGVMLGTVGGIAVSYILGIIPEIAPYTPTSLMNVSDSITKAAVVTVVLSIMLVISSLPIMNKKEM